MAIMHRHLVNRDVGDEIRRCGNRFAVIFAIAFHDLGHVALAVVRVIAGIRIGWVAHGIARHILAIADKGNRCARTAILIGDLELIPQNPFQDCKTGELRRSRTSEL